MAERGSYLETMRAQAPLVQNITNYVAMNVTANVLLAAGASPAMVHAEEEAGEFAGLAGALTVNIGTLSAPWVAGMKAAIAGARGPWVFDPVAAGATAYRRRVATELLALKPRVIRGNASEILALAGMAGTGKGVDAADGVDPEVARALARQTGAVVAVTGPVDYVTDGERGAEIANGHPLMPRVTALGCALSGLVGAFVATGPAYEFTVEALAYYGLAGEIAARHAQGPGGFAVAFLDALAALTPEDLRQGARIA